MQNDDSKGIYLSKNFKILYVFLITCIIIYLINTNNWYQGLIVLNISLHYRDFICFFTDYSDEIISSKCYTTDNNTYNTTNDIKSEKFTGVPISTEGPSNIGVSDTYNKYYEKIYDVDVNNELQYT